MATKQAKKKATRKTAQPAKAPRKTARKTAVERREATAAAPAGEMPLKEDGEKAKAKGAARKKAPKLDKKKLGEMVDKMLLQLAENVEEGECKITTSEAVRLIQLREALGLEKPSEVKVEWVEPKAE